MLEEIGRNVSVINMGVVRQCRVSITPRLPSLVAANHVNQSVGKDEREDPGDEGKADLKNEYQSDEKEKEVNYIQAIHDVPQCEREVYARTHGRSRDSTRE